MAADAQCNRRTACIDDIWCSPAWRSGRVAAGRNRTFRAGGKFGRLDHVFLIIMENETDTDISATECAVHQRLRAAGQSGQHYFAVGHPVRRIILRSSEDPTSPERGLLAGLGGMGCVDHAPNSAAASTPCRHRRGGPRQCRGGNSQGCRPVQCQISGGGTPITNNCALHDYPASMYTPESIADQLVRSHKSWKSYQESLRPSNPRWQVSTTRRRLVESEPGSGVRPCPDPEALRRQTQSVRLFPQYPGRRAPELSLQRVADFDGPDGLWANLQGQMPDFALSYRTSVTTCTAKSKAEPPSAAASAPPSLDC